MPNRTADAQLKLALQLPGNDLRIRPDLPLLANSRGRIDISHKGVQFNGLRAQLLGGESILDGASQPDGSLRLAINGVASAEALRRATELGPGVPRLAQRLQGQATYRLQTSVQNGHAEWQLASNLQGLAIELPAPLGKPAEQAMALRLSSAAEPRPAGAAVGAPATTLRDWLRLELGPLKASLLLDNSAAGGGRPLRSAWSWDAPLPEPVAGGRAVLALARLDVDGWRSVLAAGAAAAGATDDSAWLPQSLQLTTPELLLGGRRLSGVSLDLQRQAAVPDAGDAWRAQFKADQAAGALDYRESRTAGAPGRLRAQLSRLSLPDEVAGTAVADPVAQLVDRAGLVLPAVDIEVADFELRGRRLGSLALQAANRPSATDPAGRSEWQVTRLRLKNDDATLSADGRWEAVPGSARRRMVLAFELDVANGGALLERLGFGKVLRGASGKLAGTVGWDGSPLALDLPSLGGNCDDDVF